MLKFSKITVLLATLVVVSLASPILADPVWAAKTNPAIKYCMDHEPNLSSGDKNQCVKTLRTFLKFAVDGRSYATLCPTYASRLIKPLAISVEYDGQTRAYMKCFQEWQQINITGATSPVTYRRMLQTCHLDSSYSGIPAGDSTQRSFSHYWFCDSTAKSVYLTFDDGPIPTATNIVLDILEQKGVKATFFVQGWKAEKYSDIAKDIVTRGNSIQNHTYGHPDLTTYSDSGVRWQLEQGDIAINKATGVWPTCLRPPYGATSDRINQIAAEYGLQVIIWDKNSFDYSSQSSSAVYKQSQSWGAGDIVLGHDPWGSVWQSILGQIIDDIRNKGLEFDSICSNPTARPY